MSQTGTCKSFNGLKGWGFIDMSGTDVFVHIKDCTDGKQPKTGDVLSFTTEPRQNNPEHMQAKNVTGGSAPKEGEWGAFAGPVEGTGANEGTCKAFGAKGFGFITQADGSELFVHVKDCVGSRPVPGDKLKFDIRDSETKPGQQQASNVTGGTAPLVDPNQDKGMGKGAWGPSWGAPDPWSKGGGGWGAPDPWSKGGGGWGGDSWGKGGGGGGGGWGGDSWGKGGGMGGGMGKGPMGGGKGGPYGGGGKGMGGKKGGW